MALAGFAVCVGATSGHAEAKKTYAIYLSNNFVGNDWRQQMERVANVAVNKG
ncbi:sugar ABC transporter substrate-binding protein, partial [Mesorhizobium sp. M2C.T.Ca.TU.002.02.1.1]